jgi:hypothetical protein
MNMEINGKRVVDAKTPLHISINKQDAAKGKSKDPGGCAAARAIVRTLADANAARVHLGRTYIEFDDKWVRYQTPEALRTEIVAFDRGANPSYTEGDYTLRPPSPSGRLNARPKSAGRTGGKRRRPHIARIVHQLEGARQRGANR